MKKALMLLSNSLKHAKAGVKNGPKSKTTKKDYKDVK
jgi:hypothetical protein